METDALKPFTRYYLALEGQVRGPHGLEALREMASVHAFTPDTLITPEGSEDWQPVHATPSLMAALFPASSTKFQLKAKAFAETSDALKPVSVEEMLRDNLSAEARQAPPAVSTARPSRPPGAARRRDFLVSLVFADAVGLTAYFLLPASSVTTVLLAGFFAVVNIGLYWVFYHVMSRY